MKYLWYEVEDFEQVYMEAELFIDIGSKIVKGNYCRGVYESKEFGGWIPSEKVVRVSFVEVHHER